VRQRSAILSSNWDERKFAQLQFSRTWEMQKKRH